MGSQRQTAGVLLFVVILSIYCASLPPSMTGGDSGELAAVACDAAVAHPPGYPLWTMIGSLSTRSIPWGTPAWRIALGTGALLGSAAVLIIYLTIVVWLEDVCDDENKRILSALLGAGWFGLSPLVLTYHVQVEVFALNNLLVSLILYLTLRMVRAKSPTAIRITCYLGAFFIGLSLSNQHTSILIGAPVAIWTFSHRRIELLHPSVLFKLILAGAAGLSPYFYLWWAGRRRASPLSWGDTGSWAGFWTHVSRSEYGTAKLYAGKHETDGQLLLGLLKYSADLFTIQCRGIFSVPLAAGILTGHARKFPVTPIAFGKVLPALFVVYLAVFHTLANLPLHLPLFLEIHKRFWMQPNIIVALWIGRGACFFVGKFSTFSATASVVVLLALLIVTNIPFITDTAHLHIFADYAREVLSTLPPDAVLLTTGDVITNSLRYVMQCEGARPDVTILDQTYLRQTWFADRHAKYFSSVVFPAKTYLAEPAAGGYGMRQFLAENTKKKSRPLFVCGGWAFPEGPGDSMAGYFTWSHGASERVYRDGTNVNATEWLANSWATESEGRYPVIGDGDLNVGKRHGQWPPTRSYPTGSWESVIAEEWKKVQHRRLWRLLLIAIDRHDDQHLLSLVSNGYKLLEARYENLEHFIWKNIGITEGKIIGGHARMISAYHRYLALSDNRIDPEWTTVKKYMVDLERISIRK